MLCKTLLPPSTNTLLYCTLYNSAQVSLPPFRIESVLGYNHLGSNPELFFIPLPSWIKKRAVTPPKFLSCREELASFPEILAFGFWLFFRMCIFVN